MMKELGLALPVIQAPMASISTAPLVAAVSAAGGLGSLGTAVMPPQAIEGQVRAVRALTDRPFALNFFCHPPPVVDEAVIARMCARLDLAVSPPLVPPPPFGPETLELVLALAPAAVSFHFGLPDPAAVAALRAAGIYLMSTATTVEEARVLEARGVDAIIAQGIEAGGHRGTFLSVPGDLGTLALVPQIVDAVARPVIAAGGIADARGVAAARALGAVAVQVGTAFLACPEAEVDPRHRAAVLSPRATRTRVTRLFSGRPARALVTRFLDDLAAAEDDTPDFPLQRFLVAPFASADLEFQAMWAGQAAPLIKPMPAADLVAALAG